jgi:HemY protein
MVMAELNIAAEDFPAARKALDKLHETSPLARSLTIMAAIERAEGADDAVVKGWLARALTASRGPQWVCENCNNIHVNWAPVCENCQSFDTLSWKTTSENEMINMSGAAMLPLIVGTSEEPAEDDYLIADADIVDDTLEPPK